MVTLNEAGISGVIPVSAIMVTVLPFLVVGILVTAVVILIFLDVPILHAWKAFTEKFDTFRSIELKTLEHGLGLHGIMGLLLREVGSGVKSEFGIPLDQELVFFGIMGYPNENVGHAFPKLDDLCYFEEWKNGKLSKTRS